MLRKSLLFLTVVALTTAAHASSYFPALGDNVTTLKTRYGEPQHTDTSNRCLELTWTTKYGYDTTCEFDDDNTLQSVMIQMTNKKPMLIKWAFQEMSLWTGIDYDVWQESIFDPGNSDFEHCFGAKDKSGKPVDAFLRAGGTNLLIFYDDWIAKLQKKYQH